MPTQKSFGREYTNIRYSTESGLTTSTTPSQLESPTGKGLSKSTLSLANSNLPLSSHVVMRESKSDKFPKEPQITSRSTADNLLPM